MDGPYNINKCRTGGSIFWNWTSLIVSRSRETQRNCLFYGNFSRLNRIIDDFVSNLDSNMEFPFDYESRGFRPQGWATEKREEKKREKRLFKSMLLDGSKTGVWNNKDKTRDPPEASRKTKLRLSNRLSKYRDEISIDGLSGIDASGVDRKKESRQRGRIF